MTQERSRWTDLGGPVHYLDYGGPVDGPAIVCVHGLGGSAVNWSAVAPLLAERCRVVAIDLPGHGLTFADGRRTEVGANREVLHRFVREVIGRPVILMGNSMGGMISLLQAAAEPADVTGLVLVCAAVPFVATRPDPLVTAMFAAYGTPFVGRSLLAARRRFMPPERIVDMTLKLCTVDPSRIPADVVKEHYAVARARTRYAAANRDFLAAARSVVRTGAGVRATSYRSAIRSIKAPVLMLQGDQDRLVPLAAARATARANPGWRLVVLNDAGHVPQLEWPDEVAAAVRHWLNGPGAEAARAASASGEDST
jgi:pimeloyl-ACP methyl ester carboxylesterase